MIGILGALGFAMLKNPGTTAKYTAKAFGTGRDALRLGGKGLDKMGKYGDYTRTALKTGVGGYLGYQAGGMVGDFAADAYLAYEGDTESTQRTAASMRTGGRLGGAILGAGLPNAGAIMGGIGNATGGLAGGGARVAGSISNSSRSLVKGASSWNPKLASWNPKSGSWRPTGRPRGMNDGLAPLRLLGEASNNLISRTVSAGFTAVEKANDFLNGGMLELPGKFFAYANRGDLQVAPMLSLGGRASRVAKKPVRDGFLKKRLDPSPQGLRPGKRSFKTELGFGAAGLFASVPIVIGMESQMPSNKVSAEGNITGIGSSPRGGISPELQMSTQGLTLGIHNKRKSRLM